MGITYDRPVAVAANAQTDFLVLVHMIDGTAQAAFATNVIHSQPDGVGVVFGGMPFINPATIKNVELRYDVGPGDHPITDASTGQRAPAFASVYTTNFS